MSKNEKKCDHMQHLASVDAENACISPKIMEPCCTNKDTQSIKIRTETHMHPQQNKEFGAFLFCQAKI